MINYNKWTINCKIAFKNYRHYIFFYFLKKKILEYDVEIDSRMILKRKLTPKK